MVHVVLWFRSGEDLEILEIMMIVEPEPIQSCALVQVPSALGGFWRDDGAVTGTCPPPAGNSVTRRTWYTLYGGVTVTL
jgi:hypothetical protein